MSVCRTNMTLMVYHVNQMVDREHENHHCEKQGNTQISPNLSHKVMLILFVGLRNRHTSKTQKWKEKKKFHTIISAVLTSLQFHVVD
jgi:hypothetical protein